MYHILKNQAGEFYWLSVQQGGPKRYQAIGRSTEGYTQKHNAKASVWSQARLTNNIYLALNVRNSCMVCDHTTLNRGAVRFYKFKALLTTQEKVGHIFEKEDVEMDENMAKEVKFVSELPGH